MIKKIFYLLTNSDSKRRMSERDITGFYQSCLNGDLLSAKQILLETDNISGVIDMKDENGCTPFHATCHNGHFEIANWLYKQKPDYVNIATNEGRTPFYGACIKGHFEIVKWLYSVNPSLINMKQNKGCSPFYATCYSGHIEISKWIYNHYPECIHTMNNANCTAFYVACLEGHFELAKWLYSLNPSFINMKQVNGCSPFYAACYCGHIDMAKWMFDVDPNVLESVDVYQNFSDEINAWLHSVTIKSLKYDTCPLCRKNVARKDIIKLYVTLDIDCNVCLDKIKDPHALSCGHIYCKDCVY